MIKFGCMVNDVYRFNTVLRKSAIPCELHYVINPESATKGLNTLLNRVEKDDIMVLVHQDMYFRPGWYDLFQRRLEELPDDWGVAGLIGKDENGELCGKIIDRRIVSPIVSDQTFPHTVTCLDECVLIGHGDFWVNEGLDGLDLYGTLAVLQAREKGYNAYVIDAPAEHFCTRSLHWRPDAEYERRYQWLLRNYPGQIVDSTIFYGKPKSGGTQ